MIKRKFDKLLNLDFESIEFITDKNIMPFSKLRTEFTDDVDELQVVMLDLERVLRVIDKGLDRFPLGVINKDPHTLNLFDFINQKGKLIPPQIIRLSEKKWHILDGKHRIALCRCLKMKEIPFLIRKTNLNYLHEI